MELLSANSSAWPCRRDPAPKSRVALHHETADSRPTDESTEAKFFDGQSLLFSSSLLTEQVLFSLKSQTVGSADLSHPAVPLEVAYPFIPDRMAQRSGHDVGLSVCLGCSECAQQQ